MVANVDSFNMDSSSVMSTSEQNEHRYRRMLQSNNAASKRYQINRKRKLENQEADQILLTARNMDLKGKVDDLESQVAKIRTALFNIIKNRKPEQIQTSSEQVQTHPALAQLTTSIPQNDTSILSFDLEFF